MGFSQKTKGLVFIVAMSCLMPGFSMGQSLSGDEQRDSRRHIASADPVAAVGHGALFDAKGNRIEPTKDFISNAVNVYLERLISQNEKHDEFNRLRKELAEVFRNDDITQRFLMLEWLTNSASLKDGASLYARSSVLRKEWYKLYFGEKHYKGRLDPVSNFPHEIASYAKSKNMLRKATNATGKDYMQQCRDAGVPIPPDWRDEGPGEWEYVDDLNTNFLGFGNPASVYRYDSDEPAGLCMALPRISGSNISALGVICMGRESSNVCFFDAEDVPIDAAKEIETFLSGGSLGGTGVCTDCHAGENPYIVHPGGPLDMSPDHFTEQWYRPLVRPDWPQNPGPFALLSQVPIDPMLDSSCESCHKKPIVGAPSLGDASGLPVAGRFPDILALNQSQGTPSGYCSDVMLKAMGSTMPSGGAFQAHADAMRAFCKQTAPGQEVPLPDADDDPLTISPPIVMEHLFACAEAVEIRGGIYGAKLVVNIDGSPLPGVTITKPSGTVVKTPPLVKGQVVTAYQEKDGLTSNLSASATVLDHTDIYPAGLPQPVIDPQIVHQCGRTIAVRHVRGAKVEVLTNGANGVSYSPGSEWTNLPPKIRPFNLGDRYSAVQSLCGDKSDLSTEVVAGVGPSPMPIPEIEPSPPLEGQEVINLRSLAEGALTTVLEATAGGLTQFATAVTGANEIDIASGLGGPLAAGQTLSVESELCKNVKISFPKARPCEELPVPTIAPPLVGATSVFVTNSVAGARVLIYDTALVEIGDGSGDQIGLTRALVPGDVLTVVQRLGKCISNKAFQIRAVCTNEDECN